jgi:hypothetical protein
MIRSLLPCAFLGLLVLAGCQRREGEGDPNTALPSLSDALAVIVDKDATADALRRAEHRIADTLSDPWTEAAGSGWRSVGSLAHERGILVFQHQQEQPQNLRVSLLGDGDHKLWQVVLELGTDFSLIQGDLLTEPGVEEHLVRLETRNANTIDTVPCIFLYSIEDDGCRLAWTEDRQGHWAGDQLGAIHPHLTVAPGQLASRDLVDQLVALMHLSQPDAKKERQDARTRSILTTLAAGVANNRLAEAAARVLTLP